MKYVLVTGATGFIGSHLIEKLLEKQNNDLIILKRSSSDTWRINEIINNYEDRIILVDVDKTDLEKIFEEYEIEGVFHLATFYNRGHPFDKILEMTQSNIEYPVEILNLAVQYDVKYFINTGTFSEYKLNEYNLIKSQERDPKTFYDATKIVFEDLLKYYANNFDIKTATVKIYSPYGERDDEEKIIPYIILNTLRGNPVEIRNPNNHMNIIYVSDIVNLFIYVSNIIGSQENYHHIYHAKNEVVYPITEINSKIQYIIENFDQINENTIETVTDYWKPIISIDDGLYKTVKFYKNLYNL